MITFHGTIRSRVSVQTTDCIRILNYCKGRTGYDDIIALRTPIAEVARDEAAKDEIEPEEITGFVYLMKSGRHYKIGRSNAAGHREYELTIQIPEKLITVYTIRHR